MQLPVAQTWYPVIRIDDSLSLILEDYTDAGWRRNIWHVRGRNKNILVDSGMGIVPLKSKIAMLTERDLVGVETHCHYDQASGHREPPRVCRRLHFLRGWSYEYKETIFPGNTGTSRTHGV